MEHWEPKIERAKIGNSVQAQCTREHNGRICLARSPWVHFGPIEDEKTEEHAADAALELLRVKECEPIYPLRRVGAADRQANRDYDQRMGL